MSWHRFATTFCVATLTLFSSALSAQKSAKPTSVCIGVTDPSGAAIPFARIEVLPSPIAPGESLTADREGKLSADLSPGAYDLKVSFPGFRSETRHVQVQEGTQQTIAIILTVGGCTECVTVENADLTDLPVPYRSPLGELIGGCTSKEVPAQLLPSDPVYGEAAELEDRLDDVGLTVRCTLASKMQHIFERQKGAAFYRTDEGSFEVLFLPKTKIFARLNVIERRENNGYYVYSFRGSPRSSVHMDGSAPSYFIKRGNTLFYVWGDQQLATTLQAKLGR